MTLNEYQQGVKRTAATTKTWELQLAVLSLGLSGEAGEFSELVKKHLGHGHELPADKALKELGDVLWYAAALADHLGFDLEHVAYVNLEKLRARYPDGFSTEASKAKADEVPWVLEASDRELEKNEAAQ